MEDTNYTILNRLKDGRVFAIDAIDDKQRQERMEWLENYLQNSHHCEEYKDIARADLTSLMSVEKCYALTEKCDGNFEVVLTRTEMLRLAEEIKNLVG